MHGNLAPNGAVIKQTAASPHLLQHRGRALFLRLAIEMLAQIDRDDLPVDRDTVLVMRNCGPKGAPGFPEWGHIPMPRKLLNEGVTDMVRISDARMSGTSYGTVVLHVAPESAIGGPLALVETGDEILLDVPEPQARVAGSRQMNWIVARAFSRRRPVTMIAATAVCSWTTSRKPIRAAISISSCPSIGSYLPYALVATIVDLIFR